MMKKGLTFCLGIFFALMLSFALIPTALETPVWAATNGYFTYSIENGEATITDVVDSVSGSLTIPSTLGGYPVTAIGDDAFYLTPWLTSVTIPDSVTSIGKRAFENCDSLTSVVIPNSVTSIASFTFSNCKSLASVTIPDSVTSIGSWAFDYCKSLTSVTIPDSVTSIGGYAFNGCTSLTDLTLGSGVTTIESCAFYQCASLDDVWYVGTEADRNNITIGSSLNSALTSATWHYIQKGTTGDCTWTLKDNGVLTISGNGAMDYHDYDELPWGTSITEVVIENGVTNIGSYAFYRCKSLTSVTIGNSVWSIGEQAFHECESLTSIEIPDSVGYIGVEAFSGCTNLASIKIPDSIDTIGYRAFEDTAWLAAQPEGLVYAGKVLYNVKGTCPENVVLKEGTLSISGEAFYNCETLISIEIPDSVTFIGEFAFYDCRSLTTITIPVSLNDIDYNAFWNTNLTDVWYGGSEEDREKIEIGMHNEALTNATWHYNSKKGTTGDCIWILEGTKLTISGSGKMADYYTVPWGTSITEVIIENGVTNIGMNAFSDCSSLTSIVIPDSVTSIGGYAFSDCRGLTAIVIPDSVTYIGEWTFYGCSSLTSITIPNSVTDIDYGAFAGCSSLTSIVIPDSVTSIGGSAFYDCRGLTAIVIPDSVTSIGYVAFAYCDSLTSITIPNSVTNIDYGAFYGCSSLADVWYGGNEEDRGNITIDSGNECLTSATWHYYNCQHVFDHPCDTTCNECGEERIVNPHVFDLQDKNETEHWLKCSLCGFIDESAREAHVFDHACDTTCNVCDFERTITHDYSIQDKNDSEHWLKCSLCGVMDEETRKAHLYDNACDTTCNVCGQTRTITHNYEWVVDTEATCGEIGFKHEECIVCHTKQSENTVIPATGNHTYDNVCDAECNKCQTEREVPDHVYDNACDKDCNVCSSERVPSEHIYSNACDTACNVCDEIREVPDHVYNNTCDTTCNVCDEIRAISHTYDNACDTTCNVCGEVRTTSHDYSVWGMDETEHWLKCSGCSLEKENTRETHIFDDEIDLDCNTCGNHRYDASGSTEDCIWTLKDGILTISGSGNMGSYTASEAAPWGTEITKVTIQEGVANIGDYAFYNCALLTEVTIPTSVKKLGLYAFKGTVSMEKVHVSSIASYLGISCSGNNDTAWYPLRAGEAATLYVDGEAVIDLVIPEGITSVPAYSFHTCKSIKSLTLPSTLTSIGAGAFRNSGIGGTLYIPEGFTKFSSTYTFSQTNLEKVVFLGGKVTDTNKNIFNRCLSLTTVVFQSGMKTINEGAFDYCSALESIVIPDTVTTIGKNAFRNCNLLTNVYYTGTDEDRDEISIDSNNNNPFKNATWYYNSCMESDDYLHLYDDASDTTCSKCGFERKLNYTGDCTWILVGKKLIISGNGAMGDYAHAKRAPWGTSITEVVIENGVTNVGSYAFSDCKSLTSVTIPDSVMSIGYDAFYGCTSLASVTIPDSVTSIGEWAFAYCDSLTSISIPDSVTLIDEYAFYDCRGLTAIVIPDSVTSIGYAAFEECTGLTSVTIGNSVTSIGERVFSGCESLTAVTFGKSVTSIGKYAFSGCTSLTDVWYVGSKADRGNISSIGTDNGCLTGATWHYIQKGTTGDCTWILEGTRLTISGSGTMGDYDTDASVPWGNNLTEVILENGVTTIGMRAFKDCTALKSVTLPESLTFIRYRAFYGCSALEEILLPQSLTATGTEAFYGCSALKTVLLPEGFTTIGNRAFKDCTALKSIFLPESLTSIGVFAFENCAALTRVIIPQSYTEIGECAFYGCSGLTDLVLYGSVSLIHDSAFAKCDGLANVWYEGTEEERSAISVLVYNDALANATWHYDSCMANEGEWTHDFDHPCDTDCNVCGEVRAISHTFDNACDTTCNICGEEREVPDHVYESEEDTDCNECGFVKFTVGDLDGEEGISCADVAYLLYHTLFGEERYPLNQPCDYDKSGTVDSGDAIYLLYYTLFGKERYPLL